MTENEFEEWMLAHKDTQASKKFRYYVREILSSQKVKNFVIEMRKQLNIPQDGFDGEEIGYIFPPQGWTAPDKGLKTLRDEIVELCKEYEIHYFDGVGIFEGLVFYNSPEIVFQNHGGGLCMVTNLAMEAKDPYSETTQDDDNRLFPLAIRFSPYATKRDLLDYISKVYKHENY